MQRFRQKKEKQTFLAASKQEVANMPKEMPRMIHPTEHRIISRFSGFGECAGIIFGFFLLANGFG
jgi:hypothetical protein